MKLTIIHMYQLIHFTIDFRNSVYTSVILSVELFVVFENFSQSFGYGTCMF